MINKIKMKHKNGALVAKSIVNKQKERIDDPMLKTSSSADKEREARENAAFEKLFISQQEDKRKKEQDLDDNLAGAFACLWEHCDKNMKDKVKEKTDFETRIMDDPIELMKELDKLSSSIQENRCEWEVVRQAWTDLEMLKQQQIDKNHDKDEKPSSHRA